MNDSPENVARLKAVNRLEDAVWFAAEAGFTREDIEREVGYACDSAEEDGELNAS